jgi:hypothetical protein
VPVERGNDKHSPRQDEQLKAELSGMLGSAGGHREEWLDPEGPADDDAPRPDMAADPVETDERLERLRHDMDVANDSRFAGRDVPGRPEAE